MEFPRQPLTPSQLKLYRAILEPWRDHGVTPSLRGLAIVTAVTPMGVDAVLKKLRDKGYIADGSITPVEVHRGAKTDADDLLRELGGTPEDDRYALARAVGKAYIRRSADGKFTTKEA